MSHRPKFSGLGSRTGRASGRPLRLERLSLHVERLEDRRVMNADDPLASTAAASESETVQTAPSGTTATDAADDAPATFASREELRQWLIGLADAQWGQLFGQRQSGWGWSPYTWLTLDGDFATNRIVSFAADVGTTNVQVAGVDEADLVETDGEHLYIISGRDLVIVRAGVGEELAILSRLRLDENITGMYLDGNRLALVSTTGPQYSPGGPLRLMPMILMTGELVTLDDPQLFGLHQRGPTTTVTLLDVSDPTAPALVKKTEFDGTLVDSRTVDGQLRLVIANDFNLPQPIFRRVEGEAGESASDPTARPTPPSSSPLVLEGDIVATGLWIGDSAYEGAQYQYETRDEYIERVIDALLDDLPSMRDIGLDGEVASEARLVTPEGIFRPDRRDLGTLTTVATIDMHGSGAVVDKASVFASGQPIVYGTEGSLYLLAQSSWWFFGNQVDAYEGPQTNVWKFDFNAESHKISLGARGNVDGTILNQFAVDEHEGRLRVVTTGNLDGGQKLQVLEQTGKRLQVVGSVGGLAPGESLYSVRFMGDVAFAVTFRRVDPLFVIDLSDPTAPEVVGELKIPGYSDYLQMLDDGRLMGIGRAADETTGLFEELQVSLFDVSDLSDPTLVDRYSFGGGRSTATQATGDRWAIGDGDHLAVSYFAAAGLVAIPVYSDSYTWGDDEAPLFEPGEGGLQLFRVDEGGVLVPVALIEHDDLIHRSLIVGGNLVALSDGTVTVHALDDPTVKLGELDLGDDDSNLTLLRAWAAAEEVIDVPPRRGGIPIDAFAGTPEEAAMGPAPLDPGAVAEASRSAAAGIVETAPEEIAVTEVPGEDEPIAAAVIAEDDGARPAALAAPAAEFVGPSAVVRQAASVATVIDAIEAPTVGTGVGWLALGKSSTDADRESKAAAHDGDGRQRESAASSTAVVRRAASVAAWEGFDLRSLDAAFGDDAKAGFDAWDEARDRPGLGPLLA